MGDLVQMKLQKIPVHILFFLGLNSGFLAASPAQSQAFSRSPESPFSIEGLPSRLDPHFHARENVKDIEKLDAAEIDLTWLIENGKAHPKSEVLRVLGNGEISKSVTVKARYFTPSAKEKIEKAGGKAELV